MVRKDAYPEDLIWRDTGCNYHPACLSCPLPVCRYEKPYVINRFKRKDRHVALGELRAAGYSVKAAAAVLGISVRVAFRDLREMKEANP